MNSKRITLTFTLLCIFSGNNLLALDPFETKEGLKAALLVYPFFIIPGMLLNLFKSTPQPGVTIREALQNMFTPRSIGTYTPSLEDEFSRELENIINALENPEKIDKYALTEYKKVTKLDSIEDVKRIPHLWELYKQDITSIFDALKYLHQIVIALLERTRLQNLSWWQRLYLQFKGQGPAIKQQIADLNYMLENQLAQLNEFLHSPKAKKLYLTPSGEKFKVTSINLLTDSAEKRFNEFYAKYAQTQS